jgi:hypothetical protein
MRRRSQQREAAHNGRSSNGKGIIVLSRDQIVDALETGAKQRTGLSARAMLRRYRYGRLPDPGSVADLIALSNLLRKNDPILAE